MRKLAQESGTVINAVLFGAMCGAGVLPLPRDACEQAIRRGGRGAEASLRGFTAGCDIAAGARPTPQPPAPPKRASEFDEIMRLGIERLTDYQGAAYADLFSERMKFFQDKDKKLSAETARH